MTRELLELNFLSFAGLTELVLPHMLLRKDGQVRVPVGRSTLNLINPIDCCLLAIRTFHSPDRGVELAVGQDRHAARRLVLSREVRSGNKG